MSVPAWRRCLASSELLAGRKRCDLVVTAQCYTPSRWNSNSLLSFGSSIYSSGRRSIAVVAVAWLGPAGTRSGEHRRSWGPPAAASPRLARPSLGGSRLIRLVMLRGSRGSSRSPAWRPRLGRRSGHPPGNREVRAGTGATNQSHAALQIASIPWFPCLACVPAVLSIIQSGRTAHDLLSLPYDAKHFALYLLAWGVILEAGVVVGAILARRTREDTTASAIAGSVQALPRPSYGLGSHRRGCDLHGPVQLGHSGTVQYDAGRVSESPTGG